MKKVMRFTAFVTLAAFLGLSVVETFHSHAVHQTTANCPVCQIAHQTPAILTTPASLAPSWTAISVQATIPFQSYVQFVFVSHGLSPPVL